MKAAGGESGVLRETGIDKALINVGRLIATAFFTRGRSGEVNRTAALQAMTLNIVCLVEGYIYIAEYIDLRSQESALSRRSHRRELGWIEKEKEYEQEWSHLCGSRCLKVFL
jgi:hypothetical protein